MRSTLAGVEELGAHARCNTDLLRNDAGPFWRRLREVLAERGVDPRRSVLATSFPDDNSFEFGIVVTADGEAYEFGFDYLDADVSAGTIVEWTRITDRWRDRPHRTEVEAAFSLLTD